MSKSGRKMKKEETVSLSGFHIYHDNRGRTIYYNIFNHVGYIIDGYEKTYRTLSMKFLVGGLAGVLAYSFELGLWISLALGVAAWGLMELRFRKFLKGMPKIDHFKPVNKVSMIEGASHEEKMKLILKAVLWLAFGICLILNAYMKGYTDFILILNYAIAVAAFGLCIVQVLALARKGK